MLYMGPYVHGDKDMIFYCHGNNINSNTMTSYLHTTNTKNGVANARMAFNDKVRG